MQTQEFARLILILTITFKAMYDQINNTEHYQRGSLSYVRETNVSVQRTIRNCENRISSGMQNARGKRRNRR